LQEKTFICRTGEKATARRVLGSIEADVLMHNERCDRPEGFLVQSLWWRVVRRADFSGETGMAEEKTLGGMPSSLLARHFERPAGPASLLGVWRGVVGGSLDRQLGLADEDDVVGREPSEAARLIEAVVFMCSRRA
jgi:hypothetical protein